MKEYQRFREWERLLHQMQSITSSSSNDQVITNDMSYGRSTYQSSTNPFMLIDSYGETNVDEMSVVNEKALKKDSKKSTDIIFKIVLQGMGMNIRAVMDGNSIIVGVKSDSLLCNGSMEDINKVGLTGGDDQ